MKPSSPRNGRSTSFWRPPRWAAFWPTTRIPRDFIRDNLLIQTHVIDAAYRYGTQKLLFLGSSCIYPKLAPQPMPESSLLSGPLEPTNSAYAIAKIAGIEMCRAYQRQYGFDCVCLMPTNLYGPGDNFDLENSHVLPALIRKFHEAKTSGAGEVAVWGTGTPRREFLYADDLADAAVFLMNNSAHGAFGERRRGRRHFDPRTRGADPADRRLRGAIRYDTSKPDGTPRKLLDVSLVNSLGWHARTPLRTGIETTCRAYSEGTP